MSNKITILKLTSAEEIIAEVIGNTITKNVVKVKNPMVVMLTQGPQGGYGIALIPWISSWGVGGKDNTPDAVFDIQTSQILGNPSGEVPKAVEDLYLKNTSKIQLV